ncbi:MAG TPA: hypothetical protein DEP53_02180 [Bacteroidetes bacterium]|nr:hypothetical protein [Bacteroidota bacterium]
MKLWGWRRPCFLFVGILLLPGSGAAQKSALLPQDTIARIGATVITARDLMARLELMPFPARQTKADVESVKAKALYAMIAEKVLAHSAYRQGMSEDGKTRLMKHELENLFVRDELYRREIVARAVPSREEIAEGMARVTREIQVLSFLVPSQNEGTSLARMLLACKPDSVLQNITRSSYTRVDTIMIRFGAPDTAFENAAYGIGKSRVSRLINSDNFGWAVLYLLDKRSFRPAVELGLADRLRRVEQILRERHEQDLVKTYSFGILKAWQAVADSVIFHALADSISALWKEDTSHFKSHGRFILTADMADLIMVRLTPLLGSTFVTIEDGNLSLGQVLEMFRYLDFSSGSFEGDPFRAELNEAVKDLVAKELLVREGRRQGLQNSRAVQNDLQPWTEYWAARSLYYRIRDSVSVSDEEIIRHLIKNSAVFGASYQVNVREVLTANLADMSKVIEELRQGRSFADLARNRSLRTGWAKRNGESGLFDVSEHPEVGFRALMADTGTTVGPVNLTEGYSLFKVLARRRTKRALTAFDSLKTNIQQRLIAEKRKESLNRFVAEQAREQRVTIDHEKLRRVRFTGVPTFTRRFIGFGGRLAASPLLMQLWDWMSQFQKPPSILP